MKKAFTLVLALVLVLSLAACGSSNTPSNTPSGNNTTSTPPASQGDTTPSGNDTTPSENNSNKEIDLSQFTPKELPESSLLEEWMKPEFGVITSGSETMKDYMYQFTVSGVTKANEESYRQLIESKGFVVHSTSYTYRKDGIQIALGTAGIETTSDSIMTVTIEKT